MRLNPAVDRLSAPPIPEALAWARAYDGARGPLIDLSQAAPGHPPLPALLSALGAAAGAPEACAYGDIEGEPVLRAAYAAHVSARYGGAAVRQAQVHITSGCNQAFAAVALALAGPGEAIALTTPYYFNQKSTAEMFGVRVDEVACSAASGFAPDLDALRAALRTVKALALVSPNNPTGAVYAPALLDAIFEACKAAGVWLILDETYRDFTDMRHDLFRREDWGDTLIQLYSFSKSFAIPGHRLGAVVAGEGVVGALAKVMDNLQICAPRAPQIAVAEAIEPLAPWREANRLEIERRAAALRAALDAAPGWDIAAMGAYFAYVRHPFTDRSSMAVAKTLAERCGVLCLPGSFFGAGQERHLRLAFANVDVATIGAIGERLSDGF